VSVGARGQSMGSRARRAAPRRRRSQRGQATVEFALVLPAVVIVMLLLFQVLAVGRDYLLVVHTTREAARAAAADPNGDDAVAVVQHSLPGARLALHRSGETITAEVRYAAKTDMPIVGRMLPDVDLRSALAMWIEW
jgi:Flp pilus assembly protein TadG